MGLPATFSIIFAAISNLRKQEKLNPPSHEWFWQWLKTNSSLHTIKTKPIARVRLVTHTEDDLNSFFKGYQNTLE